MRIVTNPGSNLPEAAIDRYDVHVTAQNIVVDGEAHDTRDGISLATIDAWVRTAKVHPYVVGTTAAEFVSMFRELAARDREIFVVMTSRKLIGSHDAAISAAKTLSSHAGFDDVRIVVGDTGVTDVGAGLATILAGEAMRAGLSLERIAEIVEAFRTHAQLIILPQTLDYLVKGGRATTVRAWLANVFQVRPLIGFVDGEVAVVGKVSAKAAASDVVTAHLVEKLGEGRAVWVAITHANAVDKATALEAELRTRFDVRFAYVKPLAPSIYLHAGPGSAGAVVLPLDVLPFSPATPPQL